MAGRSGGLVVQDTDKQRQAAERLQQLYDLHARPTFRFLLRLTLGDRQAAEDLLQETFIRAWRNIDHLNADVQTLRPWLFTVARRVAIDAGRARHARPAESTTIDLAIFPAIEDSIEELLAAETVRNALHHLSPAQRTVLDEIYFRGHSIAETAANVGIPEGTVKSRTYHALRALREAVGPTNE